MSVASARKKLVNKKLRREDVVRRLQATDASANQEFEDRDAGGAASQAAAGGGFTKKSTPEQQVEFLRSLKEEVSCEVEHIQPLKGCARVDFCRVEGPTDTQK
ncbi:unnamed protein product, partial [Effrenium voratum]